MLIFPYTAKITNGGKVDMQKTRRASSFISCMGQRIQQLRDSTNISKAEEKKDEQMATELIYAAGNDNDYFYLRAHPEAMSLTVDLHIAFMIAMAYINADSDPDAARFIGPAMELRQRISHTRQPQ